MIEAIVSHYTEGNKAKFASLLGVSAQTVSAWVARSTFDAELIYAKCSDISASWLLTGEGSMFRDERVQIMRQTSSVEESIIYKMYEKKDEENKSLIEEIGGLKERIRTLESKIIQYESELNDYKDNSTGLEDVKNVSTKKPSSRHGSDAGLPGVPLKNI